MIIKPKATAGVAPAQQKLLLPRRVTGNERKTRSARPVRSVAACRRADRGRRRCLMWLSHHMAGPFACKLRPALAQMEGSVAGGKPIYARLGYRTNGLNLVRSSARAVAACGRQAAPYTNKLRKFVFLPSTTVD
jgi:hypothetical protein